MEGRRLGVCGCAVVAGDDVAEEILAGTGVGVNGKRREERERGEPVLMVRGEVRRKWKSNGRGRSDSLIGRQRPEIEGREVREEGGG
ncbi:hypothetical protein HAX54_043369 [Datura stramonium]|uniref:Uncharacterized protein n=1 Tax=Datura stramonium TaxID=4076 RepID=A0ABS8SNL2_DATST|nr:hypothetical protein [Datura stramonium]